MHGTYARVSRGLVESPEFLALSDAARQVVLWLAVAGHWSGLSALDANLIAAHLVRPVAWAEGALAELAEAEIVWLSGRTIYVPGALEAFPPANPNMLCSAVRHGLSLPDSPTRAMWAGDLAALARPEWVNRECDLGLSRMTGRRPRPESRLAIQPRPLAPAPTPPSPAPPETPAEAPRPVEAPSARAEAPMPASGPARSVPGPSPAAILGAWNDNAGQHVRAQSFVSTGRARLAEGYTLDDLGLVARWAAHGPKSAWFAGANDRKTSYLSPRTLWRQTNFPRYLEQAGAWVASNGLSDRDAASVAFVASRLAEEPADAVPAEDDEVPEW